MTIKRADLYSITNQAAQLWPTADGRPIGRPMVHSSFINQAVISPDGRSVLTGGGDGAKLWSAVDGRPIGQPMALPGVVVALAFSPDGRILLTTSIDATVRFWSAADGTPIGPPLMHPDRVLVAAFHPDGRTILTACEDKFVRLWRVPSPFPDDARRAVLWTQWLTGARLDDYNKMNALSASALRGNRRALGE